jgi:hypothetical protein
MICRRAVDPRNSVITICAVIQGVLVFAVYGPGGQHVIYDPVLVAGILIGLASMPVAHWRKILLVTFLGLGILGQAAQARRTLLDWKFSRSTDTANLYADPAWAAEWSTILGISRTHKLFLLSYGTGPHHYFPSVQTADAWFVRLGQFLPSDKRRFLAKIQDADVIVEDLSGPTSYWDSDEDIQREFRSMCLTDATANFQVWWKYPPDPARAVCMANLRRELQRH